MAEEIPPNKVLYVNNLNEKLHVENALKLQLYRLFSQYGKVEEVIAFRGLKGRGQAWIVYSDVQSATVALRSKQGFCFFDKPLKIAYAKIQPSKTQEVEEKVAAGRVSAAAQSNKKRKATGGGEPAVKKAGGGD